MNILKLGSILLFLLITSTSFAQLKTVSKEVEGYGNTREEAIQNALIEAIKQSKGVQINSKTELLKLIEEKSKSKNGVSSHKVNINTLSSSTIKEITKGRIERYEIIETNKNEEENEWQAVLTVYFTKYSSPGLKSNRRRLAILPFRGDASTYKINGKTVTNSKLSQNLVQELNNELIQTRKFSVLDRTYVQEVLSEKKLIISGETHAAELSKIGKTLGADYVIVGQIKDASFGTVVEEIGDTGITKSKQFGNLKIHYRILVMATKQIKWSDTVTIKLEDLDQSKTVKCSADQFDQMINNISDTIANQLLENIYPIRISKVSNAKSIILNQGGKSLKEGGQLEVFQLGEMLTDEYTGESLGQEEIYVGKATVRRITAKMSYAIMMEGIVSKGKKYICRRVKKIKKSTNLETVDEPQLPF